MMEACQFCGGNFEIDDDAPGPEDPTCDLCTSLTQLGMAEGLEKAAHLLQQSGVTFPNLERVIESFKSRARYLRRKSGLTTKPKPRPSPRMQEVFDLKKQGLTQVEIGQRLGISQTRVSYLLQESKRRLTLVKS